MVTRSILWNEALVYNEDCDMRFRAQSRVEGHGRLFGDRWADREAGPVDYTQPVEASRRE